MQGSHPACLNVLDIPLFTLSSLAGEQLKEEEEEMSHSALSEDRP